jgi:hypothetical protein
VDLLDALDVTIDHRLDPHRSLTFALFELGDLAEEHELSTVAELTHIVPLASGLEGIVIRGFAGIRRLLLSAGFL